MNLNDIFYLGRAGRYDNPLNSNDRLPIVYGDLEDGPPGVWRLPCIDTVNKVYCFADHAVLSVANGNSIAIYSDGVLIAGGSYTFDESNDYESEGAIATVTFDDDQKNKVITATGSGKASGATLYENIIDIANDWLTSENDFDAVLGYNLTAKARASAIFDTQSYKAAGVIDKDIKGWELLQKMLGSFLGSVYMDGEGKLAFSIDDNQTGYWGWVVPRGDVMQATAKRRLENVINQCPCNYAYNYAAGGFAAHTDDSADADAASQNIYGTRKPDTPYQFYWCRDSDSVDTVQAIIISKFAEPVWEVDITDKNMKRAHIDVNDWIALNLGFLYTKSGEEMINQYFKVVSVRPDFNNHRIHFRAIDTGLFMTGPAGVYIADGTHLADGSVKAGGDRDTTRY